MQLKEPNTVTMQVLNDLRQKWKDIQVDPETECLLNLVIQMINLHFMEGVFRREPLTMTEDSVRQLAQVYATAIDLATNLSNRTYPPQNRSKVNNGKR